MQYITTQFSSFNGMNNKNLVLISVQDFITIICTGVVLGFSSKDTSESIELIQGQKVRNGLKKSLPAVTISAICWGGFKKTDNKYFAPNFLVEIDKLENAIEMTVILKSGPFILILFLSRRANGLMCIVGNGKQCINPVFEGQAEYFMRIYFIEIEGQVKDESRLCYYSYDSEVFVNESSKCSDKKPFESAYLFLT